MSTRITTPAGPTLTSAGASAARYELRWCSQPPASLALTHTGEGFLYEGPHGPAYADAKRGRMRVRGPIRIDCGPPLADMRDALEHGGVTLTADGEVLHMCCEEGMSWRQGRAMRIRAGRRELVRFAWRRRDVVMQRPDGSILTHLPQHPNGHGELAGDAVALETSLLVVVHASFLAAALAPLRSWRAWPAIAR